MTKRRMAPGHGRHRPVWAVLVAASVGAGALVACAGSPGGSAGPSVPSTSSPGAHDAAADPTGSMVEGPSSTTSTTRPATTVPPATTTVTAPPTTVPPETLPEPAGPIHAGSVGTRTRAVQEALLELRFDPGNPDGRFGTKTTMAVWAFQALYGMPKDGIVSPDLEALILARPMPQMMRPDLGPTHTEIDLTRQLMLVWRDGVPLLVTHVSSGSEVAYCESTREGQRCGSAVTPLGSYHYGRRVEGWRDAPLGRLYNPVYFNGGIAVHGAGSVPDRPASHGCVRIPMHIAEYFPTLVATGDLVEVYRS